MMLMQGQGVSKGIAKGPLYFYRRPETTVIRRIVPDQTGETERLQQAQEKAAAQLTALAERCREEAGDESAALFETHAMFVRDEDFTECIHNIMAEERTSAEYAVMQAGERFAAMFSAMDDCHRW